MDDKVFNKLVEFIKNERWEYNFLLTRETTIEKELQITGNDAVDFMVTFGKYFDVDVSMFMAADYFESEGIDILGPFSRMFTCKKEKEKKKLTIGHLVKGIIAGRLDESVINS